MSRDVCATLLQSWELPRVIYVPAGYAGRSAELPRDEERAVRDLVSVLEVVELAEAVLCDEDKGEALSRLHERAHGCFGLSDDEVDAFFVELEPAIEETAELLSVQLPPGTSHAEILHRAQRQIVDVSLGTVVDLHEEQRRARELEDRNRELADRARIDPLTGLPRRGAFDEHLVEQVSGRVRGTISGPLGLLMIDVDRFKRFNDTYGHLVGDEVLRMIGRILAREKRGDDLAARYGGEEFAVVASIDSAAGLKGMAERLRRAIEQEHLENDGQRLNVTASFGGAFVSSVLSESDGVALVQLADRQLYRAKRNGRNRCEVVEQASIESGG